MRKRGLRLTPAAASAIALSALSGCATVPATAPADGAPLATDADSAQEPSGSLTFTFANDLFGGTDNNFTAAWGFTWTSTAIEEMDEGGFWRSYRDALSFLPVVGDEGTRTYGTFQFGQTFATPTDISDPNPPLDDQPYAGLLAGTAAVHARTERALHSWWLLLGIVGPSSGSEQMQKWIHELTGSDEPQGWDTQLNDEPVVNVYYEWKRRLTAETGPEWDADVISSAGGGLGNLWIGGYGSAFARFGWNLPDNFGPSVPRTGIGGFPIRVQSVPDSWSAYGFVGVDGQWVGRSLFLDGNTFEDSRSVDREPFVGTASFGIGLQKGAFVAEWLLYSQTDTYTTQDERNRFGSIAVSLFW